MHSNGRSEIIQEQVEVVSEGLRLEGRLVYPADAKTVNGAALLLPPHPFLGGDMNSNILKEIAQAIANAGFISLSFNYRGIGRSETHRNLEIYQKEFWEKTTCPEYEDKIFLDSTEALSYLNCVTERKARLFLVGYSFGSLPCLEMAMKQPELIEGLCLVSPPLAKWQLKSEYKTLTQPKAFFYSVGDFACPEEKLVTAYKEFADPKSIHRFESQGHFYVGSEKELASQIATSFKV
jgi:alpha/beta superfamily hydrolase